MAELSSESRNKLPASAFVYPDERRYPIHDISHARNALARAAGKPEEGKVRAAVYRKYPELKKSDVEFEAQIVMKAESQRLIYGVVLAPDLVDSQGDIISADVIEKAAHDYLVESRRSDVQHSEEVANVDVVESYCAPQDFVLGGQDVSKGSWVQVVKVHDDDVWARCTDPDHPEPLTGFSIGGTGVRLEEAA